MTTQARWAFYVAFSILASAWLNGCAVLLVVSGSGGGPLPTPFATVVHVAYLPARLYGIPQERWFYPSLFAPLLLNGVAWFSLGVLIATAHHAIATQRSASRRTRG